MTASRPPGAEGVPHLGQHALGVGHVVQRQRGPGHVDPVDRGPARVQVGGQRPHPVPDPGCAGGGLQPGQHAGGGVDGQHLRGGEPAGQGDGAGAGARPEVDHPADSGARRSGHPGDDRVEVAVQHHAVEVEQLGEPGLVGLVVVVPVVPVSVVPVPVVVVSLVHGSRLAGRALWTYALAHDARTGSGRRHPPADPRPAAGARLVAGRAGSPLLPQPVHAEPDRDGAPPHRPRPARAHRPRPGHHARPARRVGGRRGRGDPAAPRRGARDHDLDAHPRRLGARAHRGPDPARPGGAG